DTKNPEILKAYKLGITTGTSATTFTPNERINREQVASMLSRAIRIMVPGADFSTAGAPTFSDQKNISSWALEHVKYMSKLEIIKGTDGKFMPKAVTTAEIASGYANTTREQAIAMSLRTFNRFGK
ncbi:MAG TPA: S-layer homology domain-containing protein, partial [Bacillota bacterium]|nr:S-layer homology domain-containing protein [Bacillota bacterium]